VELRPLIELLTQRLLLRPWCDSDRALFAALNADPMVMRYEPGTLTRKESDARANQIEQVLQKLGGLGMFAIERPTTGEVLGFIVVIAVTFDADFAPATEIGWRLIPSAWGHGFATEAARAIAGSAFEALPLSELVAFTTAANAPSRAVMRRLGMSHDPAEDFDHPLIPPLSPLRRHVLYRLTADDTHVATPRGSRS
jgi:RimJ/RimL family protein N-acetyltransferase